MSPRTGLDKQTIVAAAVEMLNSQGAGELNLNRLAAQLGVKPPSLYNHIDGLPGLLRELRLLNARLTGERLQDAATGKSGAQAVRAMAQAYRQYINENPGLYTSTLQASHNQPLPDSELEQAEDRVVRIGAAVMASFGLQGEEAVHAVRGFRSMVHGFASLEIAGAFGLPLDRDESFNRLVEMLVSGLEQRAGQIQAAV